MFFGVALLSLFTATISSIFITRQLKEGRGLEQIKFKDHLVICGWNFNGEQILESLQKKKNKISVVLINHLSEEAIADITNQFPRLIISFVKGDYTKETALAALCHLWMRNLVLIYTPRYFFSGPLQDS